MVSSYVSKNYNKALRNRGKNMWVIFLLIMMQRLVTSSTTAVRQSLQKRIKILEEQAFRYESMTEAEFVEIDLEENMEEAIAAISMDIKSEIEDLNQIVAVAQQAEYQYLDVKVEPLLSIVDDIFAEDKNRKLIIKFFCFQFVQYSFCRRIPVIIIYKLYNFIHTLLQYCQLYS